jgi:uncharacterized protein YyaL (SSP411 family)
MSDGQGNALGKAASAYLRSARHQPIQWNEWGAEAFAKAEREDKPVLLDIGAVWCHWCHVMDRESYENEQTAQIINDLFVPVKVDRDERPDVDTRYQAAVQAISGQGGWPLTAFLTPDGKPYFGGTYFPPEDRYGRPGFPRVLLTMAEAFQKRRDEVNESASSVMSAIEESESFSGRGGELGPGLLEKMIESAVKQFDERNGGFGAQPKFPHSGAIDMLIDAASRPGPHAERARTVASVTLRKMAEGGIHDQLAGGFHRYSVDDRWIVPHFEKMAYDNSELLKNYVHAFQTFGDPEFARVAKGIVRWMDEWLSDRERGGFYASQDADDSLDDDGDYFTWTRDEAKVALTAEEFAVAAEFLNIREIGDMHHNTAKNVLHVKGVPSEAQTAVLAEAKRKMYAARLTRRTPYVDKTMYTGWNAMCISAYLLAGRVLGVPEALDFASKSLDRVLDAAWHADAGLAHVVAYGEGVAPAERVAGVLEDYGFLGNACLDAWEATGELRYYTVGKEIADAMVARFQDATGGGFFDTEQVAGAEAPLGALSARRKPLQDAPVPAGNPVAATLLLRLEELSGEPEYGVKAQETLETFAGIVEHFGLYAASYGLALGRVVHAPAQVCVVGEDTAAKELEAVALARYAVNKSVIRLRRGQFGALPPALAETLPALPQVEGSFAVVCRGNACLPPVQDVDGLVAALGGAV